jgi:hypothetical protein
VSLLTDLDVFSTEHRRCGDLDAGVDDVMVWIACDCGASIARRVDEDDRAATGWNWTLVAAASPVAR